jgi:hypothetical protein
VDEEGSPMKYATPAYYIYILIYIYIFIYLYHHGDFWISGIKLTIACHSLPHLSQGNNRLGKTKPDRAGWRTKACVMAFDVRFFDFVNIISILATPYPGAKNFFSTDCPKNARISVGFDTDPWWRYIISVMALS